MATAVALVESVLPQLGQSKQLAHLFNIIMQNICYIIILFDSQEQNSQYSSFKPYQVINILDHCIIILLPQQCFSHLTNTIQIISGSLQSFQVGSFIFWSKQLILNSFLKN